MPIHGEELIAHLREYFGPDGPTVERMFLVDWADRLTFIKEKLGHFDGSTLWLPDGNESIGTLYARQADIVPVLDRPDDPSLLSGRAYVKVLYGPPKADIPPSGESLYVTETLEQSAEFLTLGHAGLFWGTGSSKVSLYDWDIEVPRCIVPMVEWRYTVHRYPALPAAALTLPGHINSAPVYSRSLGLTFPAGTLLCGPLSLSREYTSSGVSMWTITWSFIHKNNGTPGSPKGWNYFPRTTAGSVSWEQLTDGTDPAIIYPSEDFSGVIL